MNGQSQWLFEAPPILEQTPYGKLFSESQYDKYSALNLSRSKDFYSAEHSEYLPSSIRRVFENAVRVGDWRGAFLNLNGLNMFEMLRTLNSLGSTKLNELWAYATSYVRMVNMPRLNYAKTVVMTGKLPKSFGDLQATGQVRDATNFLAERRRSGRKPSPVAPETRPHGTTFVTKFHPGVNHNHLPTGRWGDVKQDSRKKCGSVAEQILLNPKKLMSLPPARASQCACALFGPTLVAQTARATVLAGLPLAQKHFDHYLAGSGKILTVDLEDVIRRDSKVRSKLKGLVKKHRIGFTKIHQRIDYAIRDFEFAFGAIDRLDFEVDRASGLVHVWFMDRYEWHPVGFGYTKLLGDDPRGTNCVHAAMVELKASGAADYWMVGDAVIPLSSLT